MSNIFAVNISSLNDRDCRRMYDLLDRVRQRRADRYLRREDRMRCVVAGALLRFVAIQTLGMGEFGLEYSPLGKPMLNNHPDFHFNLSHSGQWVVIAYDSHPVGIDVEQMLWDSGKENIVRKFFTPDEQAYVFDELWPGRAERFYEIWTAKEGYLKYLGVGLQKRLDSFSVLRIHTPERYYLQLDGGYAMTLWAESKEHTLEELTIDRLL